MLGHPVDFERSHGRNRRCPGPRRDAAVAVVRPESSTHRSTARHADMVIAIIVTACITAMTCLLLMVKTNAWAGLLP